MYWPILLNVDHRPFNTFSFGRSEGNVLTNFPSENCVLHR
jgi:hypothetical protein